MGNHSEPNPYLMLLYKTPLIQTQCPLPGILLEHSKLCASDHTSDCRLQTADCSLHDGVMRTSQSEIDSRPCQPPPLSSCGSLQSLYQGKLRKSKEGAPEVQPASIHP